MQLATQADPHGTHRKCTDAVLAALDMEKEAKAEWLKDCRVWMYRGAWAEWEIENIEMCVPISPEELRAKRNSILKHQSQMESAPSLGMMNDSSGSAQKTAIVVQLSSMTNWDQLAMKLWKPSQNTKYSTLILHNYKQLMYKKILLIVSFCMFLLQAGAAEADYNVIPQPQQVTLTKDKPFNLSPNAQIICPSTDELMLKNAQFLSDYIKETTGLLLTINKNPKPKVPSIFLVIDPKIQGDEAYR